MQFPIVLDYNYNSNKQCKGDDNLKAQRNFIAAVIAINILAAASISPAIVKAETDYNAIDNLVTQALTEKDLYHYNMAYDKIMKLPESYEKDERLAKLSTIADTVWTKDIYQIVQLFEVMAREKSGKEYDMLVSKIEKSDIKEIDKQYLYSELYSWGTDTVWTVDYKKAVAAVIKVWEDKTETSAEEAEKAISELKVQVNKEYLKVQLNEAKIAAGLEVVTLEGNYFDGVINEPHIGDGKSINIDLSKDTKERTVTLKGSYQNLSINAPLATVILEDVDAQEINLSDVANHSLYLKGNTKVKKLVVNDKNDNARIVLQGKATVESAEIKSGAKIEASTDNDVQKPFGKLSVNTDTKKSVEFAGDFKASLFEVKKPADLKVTGKIGTLEIAKEAKEGSLTVEKGGSVGERKGEIPQTFEDKNVIPAVPGTGGNSGGSDGSVPGGGVVPTKPAYTIDDIVNSVVKSLNKANINAELDGSNIMLSKKADGIIGRVSISLPEAVDVSIPYGGFYMGYEGIKSKSATVDFEYDALQALADGASITVTYKGTDYTYTLVFN